jgi:hypothetical protein
MGNGVLMKNIHRAHAGDKRMRKLTEKNESSAFPKMFHS